MREKIKVPNWIKLDNAATIYPSTLSRKYAAMFRMSITLSERIDKGIKILFYLLSLFNRIILVHMIVQQYSQARQINYQSLE